MPPGGGYPHPGGGYGGPPGAGYGPPGGQPPKKGGKGLLIGGIIGGLVLVTIIVVALVFLLGGGSKISSKAHEHLPDSCDAVVRVDIKSLLETESVKEHVVPVLDKKAKDSEDAGKMAKFLITAGLDPRKDLTEAVVCFTNVTAGIATGKPDFVAIIGGDLVDGGILDAIDKHSDKDKFKESAEKDGLRVIEHKQESIYVTQAEDAALVVASKMDLLKEATKTGDHYKKKYSIPLKEQMVAVVSKSTVGALSSLAGAAGPVDFSGIGRIVVTASLDPGQLGGRLQMGSKDEARKLRDGLHGLLQGAKKGGGIPDPDAKALLEEAKISSKGDEVLIKVPIPKKLVDEAVKGFAEGLDEADDEI